MLSMRTAEPRKAHGEHPTMLVMIGIPGGE